MSQNETIEDAKENVRLRKRSLWLQANPIAAQAYAGRAKRRERAKQCARPFRPRPLLTPRMRRMAMIKVGKLQLTALDRMLDDDDAWTLERWATCEEILQGNAKAASLEGGNGAMRVRGPIPDSLMENIRHHMEFRKRLQCRKQLQLLTAFTMIQNGLEGALSPAQYGLRFYPCLPNKRMAFLNGIARVACDLAMDGY